MIICTGWSLGMTVTDIMLVENQPKSFHNSTITGNVTIPLKPEDYPSSDQVGLLYNRGL